MNNNINPERPPAQMTKKAVKQLSKPKGKPVKMIYF